MRQALTIIAVLVLGFFVGSYLNKNNINPLTKVKGAYDSMHQMSNEEMMDKMTFGLKDKVGNDFDKAFINAMITHHEGAIAMARLATIASNHKEVRDMAKNIIEVQSKEIDQMHAWHKSWFETK